MARKLFLDKPWPNKQWRVEEGIAAVGRIILDRGEDGHGPRTYILVIGGDVQGKFDALCKAREAAGVPWPVHEFSRTGFAYDACQCDEQIQDGDILLIPNEGVVGVADTWPVAVTEERGCLHALKDGFTLSDLAHSRDEENGFDLAEGCRRALAMAQERGWKVRKLE